MAMGTTCARALYTRRGPFLPRACVPQEATSTHPALSPLRFGADYALVYHDFLISLTSTRRNDNVCGSRRSFFHSITRQHARHPCSLIGFRRHSPPGGGFLSRLQARATVGSGAWHRRWSW